MNGRRKKLFCGFLTFSLLLSTLSGCQMGSLKLKIDTKSENASVEEFSVPTESQIWKESNWGIMLDQIKCDLRLPLREETLASADEIMNGNLYVDINFSSPVPYFLEDFDWNMQETQSPATFQLYLQSLGMIKYLTYAALETNDTSYLLRARAFVESWDTYSHDPVLSSDNNKVWYDHGASLRAQNIIYFTLASEELGVADDELRELISKLMIEHGDFLSQETTYVKNHNHGIYQDEALLYICAFMPDHEKAAEWLTLAKKRLQAQLEYAFTEEFVHVENSSAYCIGVIELFDNISQFLLSLNDSYGQELSQSIIAMSDFYARCVLPLGYPYAIGDSFMDRNSNSYGADLSNPFLEYVQSRGESGSPPANLSAYYPNSGYYFTQETYKKDSLVDATWTMFKAGYVSATHKHADDLSILLCSKGYEIFLDTGMYNYMNGNIYRDYLISPRAHNTVNVDGMTYSTTVENSEKTGLLYHEDTDQYRYVLGFNDMYPGVEIDRHFYSLNDAIVLFDDIYSNDQHIYSQLFHLSEDMKILSENPRDTILGIGKTGYTVHIRQYGDTPELTVLYGEEDENGNIYGYASDANNEIHPIHTLKYDLSGSDCQFITIITIEDENGRIKLTNDDAIAAQYVDHEEIGFDVENNTISIGQCKIPLNSRVHTDISAVSTVLDENTLTVAPGNDIEGMQYLWYLVDWETFSVLERSDWSTDGRAVFTVPQEAFLLKVCTKDAFGQQRVAYVAGWSGADSGRQYICDDALNYVHMGDRLIQQDGNSYLATAENNYALDYSIRWYVYKNGSYFMSTTINNNNELEIELTEPGNYTISYYFCTKNGEREYWVLPELVIP